MALTVSETALSAEVLAEIYKLSSNEPKLTPRSLETLEKLNSDSNIIAAFNGKTLAGWGLREPLTPSWFELGMLFVKPEFRAQEVFLNMCPALVSKSGGYIFATYDKNLKTFALDHWGFKETTVLNATFKTRGRFITKRLDAASRKSVSSKMKDAKPIIMIREVK